MKINKNLKVILLITFMIIFIIPLKSWASDVENVLEEVEYTDEYKEWLNLPEGIKKDSIMPRRYNINIPTSDNNARVNRVKSSLLFSKLMVSNNDKYDLRDYINMEVRNQGSTGSCWAFATNSAIESNIEKLSGSKSPLFSARYAEYATSKTFLDGQNSNAYNREVGKGGFSEIALGLYTSGRGPVLEEDLPFENNENKISISNIQNKEVQKQIKDYVRFPSINKTYHYGNVIYKDSNGNVYTEEKLKQIRDEIKSHIVKYGAVVSQTYAVGGITGDARKYYNNPNNVNKSTAYFCNDVNKVAEHQITIIGWDDDYDVTNFNETYRPKTNGAYIVLNSWGKEFGENGIYYVSYEDYFIEKDVLGIVSTLDVEYNHIYQYDELGNNYVASANGDVYGANVFERKENSKSELLTQISVSNLVDTKCELYVNSKDGDLVSSKLEKVSDVLDLKNGYHTIDLEEPIELTGDKFVVVVKYLSNTSGHSYIGFEYPDNYYWNTATAKKGQSYISTNLNNWEDVVDLAGKTIVPQNANLCIKAFTEFKEEPVKFFEIKKYNSNEEYIYNISAKTNFSKFINNIYTNMEYYIYNKNGKVVANEEIISTGMTLENEENTYKIVVKGDVNGDGKITITDVVKTKLHTLNLRLLENEYFKAADVNENGEITISDLVSINLASLNIKNIDNN